VPLSIPPVAKPSVLFTLDDLMSSEGQSRFAALPQGGFEPALTVAAPAPVATAADYL
jgi:hypothetical protein